MASVDRVWDVVNDGGIVPTSDGTRAFVEHAGTWLELSPDFVGGRSERLRHAVGRCGETDRSRYCIDTPLGEGDLGEFTGFWRFEGLIDVTSRATASMRFEIGLPVLPDSLNPVAERAIRDNSRQVLMVVASAAVPEQSVYELR